MPQKFEFLRFDSDKTDMDLKVVIGSIYSHYVLIFGTTLALFFTVSMILLIRAIGRQEEGGGGGGAVDVRAIENAMRRVLSTQAVSVVAGTSISGGSSAGMDYDSLPASSSGGEVSGEEIVARDQRIAALTRELDEMKLHIGKAPNEDKIAEGFRDEINNLKARLAEYEIIEDDIADLSMFKEENGRLKDEIEKLKAQLAEGGGGGGGYQAAEEPAPRSAPEPEAEEAPAAGKGAGFELDMNDDALKEFAQAVDQQSAADVELAKHGIDLSNLPSAKEAAAKKEEPVSEAAKEAAARQAVADDFFAQALAANTIQPPSEAEVAEQTSQSRQSFADDLFAQALAQRDASAMPTEAPSDPVESSPGDVLAESSPMSEDATAVDVAVDASIEMAPETVPDVSADMPPEVVAEAVSEMSMEVPVEATAVESSAAVETMDDVAVAADADPLQVSADETSVEVSHESAVSADASHDDPLSGSPDADKMLSEVEAIPEGDEAEQALEDQLDTDKLLQEAGSFDDDGAKSA